MAGTNEIKLFAGPSANTLTPAAWAALSGTLLTTGFSAGLASSRQANTLFRQVSLVAAGIGDFIAGHGFNALDDGNTANMAAAFGNALLAFVTASGLVVPSGAIMDWGSESPPTGWLECDGSSLLRASYPALFTAIGTAHGTIDATHFNIPDHRGKFKRGWAHGTGNDPDRASRTAAATGGATGDHVGSVQNDAVQDHTHYTLGTNTAVGTGPGAGILAAAASNTGGMTSGNISTQTRPINAGVMSIIKI